MLSDDSRRSDSRAAPPPPSPFSRTSFFSCSCARVAPPGLVGQAVKRAERLSVSALTGLSNFMDALGAEANADLCRPGKEDAGTAEVDASQSPQVTNPTQNRCVGGPGSRAAAALLIARVPEAFAYSRKGLCPK